MPRKRDKRKLDTQMKRVKLRKAEAELSVYRRTHEAPEDYVETDPELLRLAEVQEQVNLCLDRQRRYNYLCENLLFLEQDMTRGENLTVQVCEKFGIENIEDLSKMLIPALKRL